MTRPILDGIAQAIYAEFGEDFPIYTEPVEQDLKPPCFTIQCSAPTLKRQLGRRWLSKNPCTIQYLPQSKEPLQEGQDVVTRLFFCLDRISTEMGDINGTGLRSQIGLEISSVSVNFNYFFYQEEETDPMEDLQQYQIGKEP